MTRYYTPTAPLGIGGGYEQLPGRLAVAYRTAGLPAPRFDRTDDALAALGRPHDVIHELVEEYLTGDSDTNPEQLVEDALKEMWRADAVDRLRSVIRKVGPQVATRKRPEMVGRARTDLEPAIRTHLATLRKAAPALPANDPFDAEAVLAADAGKQHKAVIGALQALTALVGPLLPAPFGLRPEDLPRAAEQALALIAIPLDLEPEVYYESAVTNPSERRERVRALTSDLRELGHDRLLLAVARGHYGDDVTLDLFATDAELRRRCDAMAAANKREADPTRRPNAAHYRMGF